MKRFLAKIRRGVSKHQQNGLLRASTPGSAIPEPAAILRQTCPPCASLEGVAVELQLEILYQVEDLTTLRALVHASSSYHKAYLAKRNSILPHVLSKEMNSESLSTAKMIIEASDIRHPLWEDSPKLRDDIRIELIRLLERTKDPANVILEHLQIDEVVVIAQLRNTVHLAMEQFCNSSLSAHPSTGGASQPHTAISSSESRRIVRAFYRFELFCRLFRNPNQPSLPLFDPMDQSHLYLALFRPWEVEEIACVRDFIWEWYSALFNKHDEALTRPGWNNSDDSLYNCDEPNGLSREQYIENCMSLGLRLFLRICQASEPERISMIRVNSRREEEFFLTRTLEVEPYDWVYPCAALDAWIDHAPLYHTGEDDGPNAAWTWATGNRVEILSFDCRKSDLRRWAYVMWDKERLDSWGALDEPNEPYIRVDYD